MMQSPFSKKLTQCCVALSIIHGKVQIAKSQGNLVGHLFPFLLMERIPVACDYS